LDFLSSENRHLRSILMRIMKDLKRRAMNSTRCQEARQMEAREAHQEEAREVEAVASIAGHCDYADKYSDCAHWQL
jgi:hypothetical protein